MTLKWFFLSTHKAQLVRLSTLQNPFQALPKELKDQLPKGLPGAGGSSGGGRPMPRLPGLPGLPGGALPRFPGGLPGLPGKKK